MKNNRTKTLAQLNQHNQKVTSASSTAVVKAYSPFFKSSHLMGRQTQLTTENKFNDKKWSLNFG